MSRLGPLDGHGIRGAAWVAMGAVPHTLPICRRSLPSGLEGWPMSGREAAGPCVIRVQIDEAGELGGVPRQSSRFAPHDDKDWHNS